MTTDVELSKTLGNVYTTIVVLTEEAKIYDIAAVIATGRSDYPNQINNALVFPGIFRGALDCHAKQINEQMYLAAANALANLIPVDQLNKENIIPSLFNENVVSVMAKAVIGEANRTGVVKNIAAQGIMLDKKKLAPKTIPQPETPQY
mgnify:CR=1 FL=1